jgi:uracil-DNA glycosylase family 4
MIDDKSDPFPPYAADRPTSYDAAASVAKDAGQLRELVFAKIHESGAGGMTCDEIEIESQLTHQTASARVNELMRAGRIVDSGRKRPTRSSRQAIVWTVVDAPMPTSLEQENPRQSILFQAKVIDAWGEEGLAPLRSRCQSCTKCVLAKKRTNVVFGEGNADRPPICFVGEGPGGTEDETGKPFVGPAGKMLDKILGAMRVPRDQVYICNAVACRPPENRKPEKKELDACNEFLVGQLRAVRPQAIVTLGASATSALFGGKSEITKLRGKWLDWEGIPVMPTYHPSYLVRNQHAAEFIELKKHVWADMQQVLRKIGRTVPT